MNYPIDEKNRGIVGKVWMSFIIDKFGNIKEITPVKEVKDGKGFTTEAIRIISIMPNWIPGSQNGKNVDVLFNLPLNFNLAGAPNKVRKNKKLRN